VTPRRRVSNPWLVVFGSTVALMVCNGPALAFTFALFVKPVGQEFGWHRGPIYLASGMATIMSAVGAPVAGRLIDRYGVRRILLPVIPLCSLSIAAISLAGTSLWTFIALYTVAGVASAAHGPQPYIKAIAGWFDLRRGLAIGIAMAGVGLGIFLLPRLTHRLIDTIGWRSAYVGLGMTVLAIAMPIVAVFVREPEAGLTARSQTGIAPCKLSGTLPALLRSRHFWLLAAPAFLAAMALNGTIDHLVLLLTDHGMRSSSAASILGAVGLASIVGRLLCGYLADRLPAPQVAAGFFLLPCVGLSLLISRVDSPYPLIAAISLGLALGCEIDMMGLLITRYFGLDRLAQIYGYLFAVFAAGAALGKYLMGTSFDASGSYDPVLSAFIVALLAASVLISRLGRYVFSAV
jgi:predicted MFS family arabinose efflux permease